jgi:hypothetical protein
LSKVFEEKLSLIQYIAKKWEDVLAFLDNCRFFFDTTPKLDIW